MTRNQYNSARYASTMRFQEIAAELGLVATKGAGAASGAGSASALFKAIASGEVVCMKRDEYERLAKLARMIEESDAVDYASGRVKGA